MTNVIIFKITGSSNKFCKEKGTFAWAKNDRFYFFCAGKHQNLGCQECPGTDLFYSTHCSACLTRDDCKYINWLMLLTPQVLSVEVVEILICLKIIFLNHSFNYASKRKRLNSDWVPCIFIKSVFRINNKLLYWWFELIFSKQQELWQTWNSNCCSWFM